MMVPTRSMTAVFRLSCTSSFGVPPKKMNEFNKVRTLFFKCMCLDPLPASTGIQARLCRSDLLIELEAFAIIKT